MKFGLHDDDWNTVLALVVKPLMTRFNAKVWVFGSRARGDARRFSDLDLLIESPQPLDASMMSELRAKLEDSNLPIKVDLVESCNLSEGYRRQVLQERLPVQEMR